MDDSRSRLSIYRVWPLSNLSCFRSHTLSREQDLTALIDNRQMPDSIMVTAEGRALLHAIEDDLDYQQDGTADERSEAKVAFRDRILAIEAAAAEAERARIRAALDGMLGHTGDWVRRSWVLAAIDATPDRFS